MSVVVLDGGCDEIYNICAPLLKLNLHPRTLVTSYESPSPNEPQTVP